MKISKLFHWLYAILMFLPILVFIPNAFYYGFNETAVAQEKTEQVPVYYETNDINSLTDFQVGRIYHWDNHYIPQIGSIVSSQFFFNISYCSLFEHITEGGIYLYSGQVSNQMNVQLYINIDNNRTYDAINNVEFDFVISQIYQENINNYMTNDILAKFTKSNLNVIKEYQPLVTNMSITDSMSYAWDSTWQNDLFSWSYDSFLTQPFLYITNLFNVPATNTLLYCLSYWLNISIIWLCFDVVMYVPLLVHRWLDKGIVE